MQTREVVDAKVEDLMDGRMGSYLFCETKSGDYTAASDDFEAAAKIFGVSPALLEAIEDALQLVASNVAELVYKDLVDIWEKVD